MSNLISGKIISHGKNQQGDIRCAKYVAFVNNILHDSFSIWASVCLNPVRWNEHIKSILIFCESQYMSIQLVGIAHAIIRIMNVGTEQNPDTLSDLEVYSHLVIMACKAILNNGQLWFLIMHEVIKQLCKYYEPECQLIIFIYFLKLQIV